MPPFNTFDEFLRRAVTNPLMEAPFAEHERRVLGVMHVRKRTLAAKHSHQDHGPLVSVIMATYNRADCLPVAIESALNQTYENLEVVVVDDGSTDATPAVLESLADARLRVLGTPQNKGVAWARNQGLAASTGEYVCYLDSDNRWDADFVRIMVGELHDRADGIRLAYSAQAVCKAPRPGDPLETKAIRFAPFNRSLLENRNYVDLNAIMHERSLYEAMGGFDEGLPRLVDWDLLLRYTEEQGAASVPCVLSYYHFGVTDDQLTLTLPMGPATRALDRTLQRDAIEIDVAPEQSPHRPFALRRMAEARYIRPVSVVIPSYEALPYLRACLRSVEQHTDGRDVRAIIVDNGSQESVRHYLEGVSASGGATVVFNEANYGFTHAANQGIEQAAPGSDVVLLNNDAVVTAGWLAGLQEVFDRVGEVGLAVPRQTLFPHTPTMQNHVPFCKLDRELDVTLSAHHGNVIDPFLDVERGLYSLNFAPFFAVYIPRETLAAVGPLDVESGPHYRSDRVYCDLVRCFHGKKIVYTPHSKLYHFLRRSTAELRALDPPLYQALYVRNDWREAMRRQGRDQTALPQRGEASSLGARTLKEALRGAG